MEQLIDFHAPEVQAVLDTLLKDKSTGKNIIWATDPPEELQTVMYESVTDRSQITTQQLGLTHYEVVLPPDDEADRHPAAAHPPKKARCSARHGSATR